MVKCKKRANLNTTPGSRKYDEVEVIGGGLQM